MTLRPLQRAALVALCTGGVLAATSGAGPVASAERHVPAPVVGPAVPSTDFIGPTLLGRSHGLSSLHARSSTDPLARKFK